MIKPVHLMAACAVLALAPATASACDFDGLPGYHRFNPFLNEAKSRWPAAPVVAPAEAPRLPENRVPADSAERANAERAQRDTEDQQTARKTKVEAARDAAQEEQSAT